VCCLGIDNDGDHNDGIDNNGIDNNGIDNNGIDNNGIDNNGDGVDGECGGSSTSPLSQFTCLAATPTSPIRAGSSRRVTANPPAAIAPVDTTAYRLSDTTAYRLSDTPAYHLSDTTEPALKKQRVATSTEESDRVWTQESESTEESDLASHLL
jgi:hypothetical protein